MRHLIVGSIQSRLVSLAGCFVTIALAVTMMAASGVIIDSGIRTNPGGNRLEIYGREGAIVIRADGALSLGPNQMHAGKGKEAMAPMPVPAKYRVVPESTPAGQPTDRQNRPRRRSRAGSTSRQVVHQPVRTVATNSSGRPSARISLASRSWS